MNRGKTSGVTLADLLIVISIIAVLTGIVWLAIAPASKARAKEAECRSNLRAIAQSVNIYIADNNDLPPANLDMLPGNIVKSCPQYEIPYGYYGNLIFLIKKKEGPAFDITSSTLAACYSHNSHNGETRPMKYPLKNGKEVVKQIPVLKEGEILRCLIVHIDGSVAMRSIDDPTLFGYADAPSGLGG